jgi:hypothetical protein
MRKNILKFIVVAPSFNENSGGVIALHYLCHKLNLMGFESYIYHIKRPVKAGNSIWEKFKYKFCLGKYQIKRVNRKFCTNPEWQTPELCTFDDEMSNDRIVIYPEIIEGNPLLAKKFIRWFLYFKGSKNYDTKIQAKNFNIFYAEHFKKGVESSPLDYAILNLKWYHSAYFKNSTSIRQGISYQVRKHDSNEQVNLPKNAVKIDGLRHEEIAKIFHSCEYFFSYDMYSFYSVYASISGCKSIVIPKIGVSEDEWRPDIRSRYGIAYGEKRIQWASETRLNLLNEINNQKVREDKQLNAFVELCEQNFFN